MMMANTRPRWRLGHSKLQLAPNTGNRCIVGFDPKAGIIRVEAHGFWSYAEADAYARDLGRIIAEVRGRLGCVRTLSDRRNVPVLQGEVADRLGRLNAELYRPEDRVALVVDSSLTRSQLRRQVSHAGTCVFLSMTTAEEWLLAQPRCRPD